MPAASAIVPVDTDPVSGVALYGAQVAHRAYAAGVAGGVHALAQAEGGGGGAGHDWTTGHLAVGDW